MIIIAVVAYFWKMKREEIFNKTVDFIVANNKEIKKEQITMDSAFEDLNLDSLDLISIITDLEKQYDIVLSNEEVAHIENVSQAIDVIEKHIAQNWYAKKKSGYNRAGQHFLNWQKRKWNLEKRCQLRYRYCTNDRAVTWRTSF